MTAEAKMRTLAAADATLQGFLGSGPFRWFDKQLQPKYIDAGTCVRVRRVSTLIEHAKETRTARSISRLERPLFQIDVLDIDSERARSAAKAIKDWFSTVDFSSDSQFASPPTTPTRHPNFVLNQRAGMEYAVSPTPVHVETLDVRIFNDEE